MITDRPEYEEDAFGYGPEEDTQETCIHLIGYWKNAQRGEPVYGEHERCRAHAMNNALEQLVSAIQANDPEGIDEYLDELGLPKDHIAKLRRADIHELARAA